MDVIPGEVMRNIKRNRPAKVHLLARRGRLQTPLQWRLSCDISSIFNGDIITFEF